METTETHRHSNERNAQGAGGRQAKVFYSPAALRGVDVEKRTAEFVISDESVDRHGTVIPIDGWDLESYNKNGIVGYQHEVYGGLFTDSDPDSVIGKGEAFVDGKQLIGRVTFEPADLNEKADKIFRKVQFGTLNATSVGFNPLEEGQRVVNEDTGEKVYHYGRRELLEFSIVNIPSNPNAVARAFDHEAEVNGLAEDATESAAEGSEGDEQTECTERNECTERSTDVLRKRLKLHRPVINMNQK